MYEDERIRQAIEQVPETFGLYGFPGQTFRLNERACYINDTGTVMLYTQVKWKDEWLDFAKGTLTELLREIREVPSV